MLIRVFDKILGVFKIIHSSQDGWTNRNIISHCQHLWETCLHNQTPGYEKKLCV